MEIEAVVTKLQAKILAAGAQRAQARHLANEAGAAKRAAYGTERYALLAKAWENAQWRSIVCEAREEALGEALQVVIDANGLAVEVAYYRDNTTHAVATN